VGGALARYLTAPLEASQMIAQRWIERGRGGASSSSGR
jgi:hypothetical protein